MNRVSNHGSAEQMLAAFQQKLDMLERDTEFDAPVANSTQLGRGRRRRRPVNASHSINDMIDAFEDKIAQLEGDVSASTSVEAAEEIDEDNDYINALTNSVNSELDDLDIYDSWSWQDTDNDLVLTTVQGESVHEFSIPHRDLTMNASEIKTDTEYIMSAVTQEDGQDVESSTSLALPGPVLASEEFIDDYGMFGDPGEHITRNEAATYFNQNNESDPSLTGYDSFEDWWNDTKQWLTPVDNCTNM